MRDGLRDGLQFRGLDRISGDLGKLDSLPSSMVWYQKSPISR